MRLVIIGAGFAGMYAALSAARLRDIQGASPGKLEIALVAPQPTLVVRPRLYESKPETLTAPLLDVLKAIDVVYVQGSAETVDTRACEVGISISGGKRKKLSYDRLVVATGSRLFRPNIPGLAEHGFSVDSLDDAIALDKHLHGGRCRWRVHRHRGGNRDAGAAPQQSRERRPTTRHHRGAQRYGRSRYG
jgi:NADH dehydrogenase